MKYSELIVKRASWASIIANNNWVNFGDNNYDQFA